MPLSGRAVAALALMAAVVTGVSPAGPSPAHKTLRIVALGDSTTATALDWAPPIKEVYADCLPRSLAAHGISATVVNAGIGDTTTRDALARLDRDVRSHHPDLVVIQFGINDSWIDVDQGSTAARLTRTEYRDNLGKIIAILKSDGAQVVLMTPNPMRWADPYYIKAFEEHSGLLDTHAPRGIDRLLDLYAADVRDVAHQEQVPLVDVFAAFEDYGKVPGHSIDELLLAGDGIHPNQAGQHLVCKLLTDRIAALYPAD
jgi:lysophospholipase L1-like esterase